MNTENKVKTVTIPTILAWFIVNYNTENGLRMNRQIEDLDIDQIDIHKDIFDPLFRNGKMRVNYSLSSMHGVLYEFLRPEIITQYPMILKFSIPWAAQGKMGEVIELSTNLKYPHHTL
ncbi:MAG: hypothetical protein H6766_06910 [Candidatus Peribacteria bacterium]|nr:MAG: hypothetical protein H6766_06910 [Candidatus Peribacteria bacterium]